MLKHSLLVAGAILTMPAMALAQSSTTNQDRTGQDRTTTGQDRQTGQSPNYDPNNRSTTGQDLNRTEPAAGQDRMQSPGQSGRTTQSYTTDVGKIASGYRSTKLVGRDVVNENNEEIGSIDDLIVTQNDRVLYAIVSVGGFLGMGERLVAVPYDELSVRNNNFVMRNASKNDLKSRPEFKYRDR